MSKQYAEDWLCSAFYDLSFALYLQDELSSSQLYLEFKSFYCLQCLEKELKSFLLYTEAVHTKKELKNLSHDVVGVIRKVTSIANDKNLTEEICSTAVGYYDNCLLNHKDEFLLSETIIDEPFINKIKMWCDKRYLDKAKWYFYILEQSYFEVRYPTELPVPSDYDGKTLIYGRDGEYLNPGLLETTIKMFRIFFSLFEKMNCDVLWQHTYSGQEQFYDKMEPKTKSILERNEKLFLYISGEIPSFQLVQ